MAGQFHLPFHVLGVAPFSGRVGVRREAIVELTTPRRPIGRGNVSSVGEMRDEQHCNAEDGYRDFHRLSMDGLLEAIFTNIRTFCKRAANWGAKGAHLVHGAIQFLVCFLERGRHGERIVEIGERGGFGLECASRTSVSSARSSR